MTETEAADKIRELAKIEWAKLLYQPDPVEMLFSSKEGHFCATNPPEKES